MTPYTFTLRLNAHQVLNANQRLHRMQVAERVRTVRALAAHNALHLPRLHRAHITVHVTWPDRRRRDVHNLYPSVKAAIDGIVSDPTGPGLLPDDSDRYLIGPDLRVTPGTTGQAGVVELRFEIEPLEEP